MKYALVAVFSRTKTNKDIFTYSYSDGLITGQVVKVNFASRTIYGLVLNVNEKKPDFETKEIIEALEIFLPEHLIKNAYFISEKYFAPLSLCLKTMLPQGFYKKRRSGSTSDLSFLRKQESRFRIKSGMTLTDGQKKAIDEIKNSKDKKPFLLFGATGSGKTEVYLRIIETALKDNKSAIVLVPEISLTPQTIKIFEERFPDQIAVLHSHLKETEKQKSWNDIYSGEKKIAIGARSAVFAPFKDLGVIIIDEEHEDSYKQENTPRYDAREVAEFVAKETGANLILGSATPRIESFHKAKVNKYTLLNIGQRIAGTLPIIKIVDLREEFRSGRKSILSLQLEDEIRKVLEKKRKVILFLNRRGNATYVFCRDCGYTEKCPNCEIPLTQHLEKNNDLLLCHHCNFRKKTPVKCPNCQSLAIKFYGLGTKKAEAEIRKTFPNIKILRMDRDATAKKGSHEEIYLDFKKDEPAILIGTQMIAKGLDIKEVDLVGVINADYSLNLPDFRSTEKGYQLLTQITGRSGRDKGGIAIVQTYTPENSAIEHLKKQDFEDFYTEEIERRERFGYPPFSKIITIEIKDKSEMEAKNKAERLKLGLEKRLAEQYNSSVSVLGPSPAILPKKGNFYRWEVTIKLKNDLDIKEILEDFLDKNINLEF